MNLVPSKDGYTNYKGWLVGRDEQALAFILSGPLIAIQSFRHHPKSLLLYSPSYHLFQSTMASTANLTHTVAHAVAFLIRPLAGAYPASTLVKLQSILQANLEALCAPTWDVSDPLRHSERRCIALSPSCLPPRVIYSACIAAEVQWFDWISLLGGREFDFLVDPGCVSVKLCKESQALKVWADEVPTSPQHMHQSKTTAQRLLEADREEEEQLFAMIDDEIRAPSWLTPIIDRFPMPRSPSRLSTISNHSRCSSRSSNSSSGFSFASGASASATSSFSSASSQSSPRKEFKQSRRERARNSRVFVDKSKTDVTPYDGGKTTVLTGGVMLGGPNKAKAMKPVAITTWRGRN
ncbi:hypothetical protein APHAL10511_006517 [Amanita phalloides]|nr:hypothetical protein APHAL10511_006517 [Amanita phalloides]